jgi:aquaporin NIP
MKKFIAEFLGTFALVFAGTGAVIINEQSHGTITHVGIAITFGLVIMSMIYAFGETSGAHLNPAVSIAFTVAGRFPLKQLGPYIFSQLAGAVVASFTLKFMFPDNGLLGTTLPAGSDMQSFIMEFILTFFLMMVILNVALGSKEQGMFAGIAIGGIIGLECMFAGPISGASMNPIRSLAPAVASGHVEHLWLYIVAPVLGAMAAVPVFKLLKHERTPISN